MLFAPYVCFHILVKWPPIGKIAAHSAYVMRLWYKYLIFNLVFSHLGFWSGNIFLIAPFPDLCQLVTIWMLHILTKCQDILHTFYKEGYIQSKVCIYIITVVYLHRQVWVSSFGRCQHRNIFL